MILDYTFSPTRVYFGDGITIEALGREHELLSQSLMIVTTGRSLSQNGYIDDLCQKIKSVAQNSKIVIYDQIRNNPDIAEVENAVGLGIDNGVKTVIGFGGGSSIDAAKVVAVGLGLAYCGFEKTASDILVTGEEPSDCTLPIIAIPTTAGTGSELSKAAIISDREKGIKTGIRGKNVIPKVAIVDPVYTWTIPENITMETGFDVLAHAIESYVSVKADYYSEMFSEKAISNVGKCLMALKNDINDHETRSKMAFSSMIMGYNLREVGTALPHRLQYPVGSHTVSSHGAGLIALYPSWFANEYRYSPDKVRRVAELLNGAIVNSESDARKCISEYFATVYNYRSLSELGIDDISAKELAAEVSGNIANDPLAKEPDIIEKIYSESF